MIGTYELILILVIALILFGPKRLPELARALGESMREFKKAASDLEEHRGGKGKGELKG
ncbi:MAG: twin-arginine translocase TatA/TatE family subunit [Candidatus Altiarchaeales archaeon ex4484_43]|nr:MAG: twin-arginine translocase TatA/TatE family subunit [Candidatus Altiarchaeales archaeon ex4484_43]